MSEHFVLLAAECGDESVTLHLQSTQPSADCPQLATRIHSHYQRTVADLPAGTRRVRLRLQVQEFYCDNSVCDRKIFVERITLYVAPWARMTTCLNQARRTIGLATCGR